MYGEEALTAGDRSGECIRCWNGHDPADDYARGIDVGKWLTERTNGQPEIVAIRASTVTPANVRWLWQGWIPLGMQSALIGMPGFGKTTIAMKLAADVTQGALAGDLEGKAADVLFISYEDVIEVRLRPMAEASGADLDRLHFIKCKRTRHVIH